MNGHLKNECGNDEDSRSPRAASSRRAARYTASFFGPFRITLDGRPLGEPNRRNRSTLLLKWFLLNPERHISTDELCALFWPGRRKESATNNLHVNLNHLRRTLEPELPARASSTFIRRRRNYYWFDMANSWWTDLLEVQALSAAAEDAERREETTRAISLYEQVVGYYRQTFLPEDVYEDVFAPHRQEHDFAHAQYLSRLMRLYLRARQLPKALSPAMDMMCIDPYNRDAVKTIVEVRASQGNVAGAIRQLDDFFQTLERDIGIRPDNELLALRDSLTLDYAMHAPSDVLPLDVHRR